MSYSKEVKDLVTGIVTKTIYDEDHNIIYRVKFHDNDPARELTRKAQDSMRKREEFEKFNNLKQ